MRKPSIPADEEARLHALRCYQILDTPPEREFDDVARIASHVCGMPMALVSLIDRDRQWFKARVGVEAQETTRDISFCAHAILAPDAPLIVHDPVTDPRFAGNPDVTGGLQIRFYAGIPLQTPGGHALGTLCVIDSKPNALTEAQIDCLHALARQVVALLEIRSTARELERARTVIHESEKALAMRDLVMGVAHEVNNPLTFMDMAARNTAAHARRLEKDPGALPRTIPLIQSEQERILRGVVRLTEVSRTLRRITRRREDTPTRDIDIDALLADVAAKVDAHGGVIVSELRSGVRVRGSEEELRDVVVALLENAVESMPAGRARVVLRADADEEGVRVCVVDAGHGIDPKDRSRIFSPFFSTKPEGSGCALAIARRMVEDHDGRIWFESTPGVGTTFHVSLPRARS